MKRLIMIIFFLMTYNSVFAVVALEKELVSATQAGDVAKVQELLNQKVNVNFIIDRISPLGAAVFRGDDQIAKLLIANGADVNVQGYKGFTALGLAAYSGYKNIVKLLLESGANPNTKGIRTPLLFAVDDLARVNKLSKEVIFDMVNLLLKHGADFTIEDEELGSPIQVVEKWKYLDKDDVLRLFKNYEDVLSFQKTQANKEKPNYEDKLMEAIKEGNSALVRYLLGSRLWSRETLENAQKLAKATHDNEPNARIKNEIHTETGRMLRDYLAVLGPTGRISKTGISKDLPDELKQVIASHLFSK